MSKTFYYDASILNSIPKRPENSNKGTFGRLLVIGGSYGMSGAAYLCAKAAYRSGVGLVDIFTPEENRIILQVLIPEAILSIYDGDSSVRETQICSALERADAVVIGVGLGQSSVAENILSTVLCAKVPVVIDADALNLISKSRSLFELMRARFRSDTIITPHPGEMSRLTGIPVNNIVENLTDIASDFADNNGVICVLKDHRTAIAVPHSDRIYRNQSGNSGMATAGSGDVLSGIIGALLAQGFSPEESARLGVYIHGAAGDLARDKLGEYSLMAQDIINMLPSVFMQADSQRISPTSV